MVFQCDALIAFLSRFMTLMPDDIIATGTPPGVGLGRNPLLWHGDDVECEIDGVGIRHALQSFCQCINRLNIVQFEKNMKKLKPYFEPRFTVLTL